MCLKRAPLGSNPQGRQRLIDISHECPECVLASHSDPYDAWPAEVWECAGLREANVDRPMTVGRRPDCPAHVVDHALIALAKKFECDVKRRSSNPSDRRCRITEHRRIGVDGIANVRWEITRDE